MSATATQTAPGTSRQGHILLNGDSAPAPSLDAYDEEQVRLMEERCILVNEKDEAYGEESKKTCKLFTHSHVVSSRPCDAVQARVAHAQATS